MADQASFDKPDGTSNYSNEVWETVRANVRAAAALLPGSRTNPGVGALFRSAPSAGELLLEEATNAAGSTKSTVFDSRTKVTKAGDSNLGPMGIGGSAIQQLSVWGSASSSYTSLGVLNPSGALLQLDANGNSECAIRSIYAHPLAVRVNNVEVSRWRLPSEYNPGANQFALELGGAFGGGIKLKDPAGDIEAALWTSSGKLFIGTSTSGAGSASANMAIDRATGVSSFLGTVHLESAAPSLIHRTGGQNVGEVAFSVIGGRGMCTLTTRETGGTNAHDKLLAAGSFTQLCSFGAATGFSVYVDGASGEFRSNDAPVARATNTAFTPALDNLRTLGTSAHRWSSVWAANGTIQTSDARDKTDIQPIDPAKAFAFVSSLQPIVFRWLVGGRKVEQVPDGFDEQEVEAEEEYTEQATEPATEPVSVERVREVVEMEAGRAVLRQVTETVIEQRPLGQWVDVVDADGRPVMQPTGEQREVGRGRNKRTEQVMAPRRHFVPELRPVEVKRTRTVKRIEQRPRYKQVVTDEAGRRYHAGFIAQHVRECLTAAGLDQAGQALGLWVQDNTADADSAQSLRPDQFIPLLVAAMQHLAARLAKVEG